MLGVTRIAIGGHSHFAEALARRTEVHPEGAATWELAKHVLDAQPVSAEGSMHDARIGVVGAERVQGGSAVVVAGHHTPTSDPEPHRGTAATTEKVVHWDLLSHGTRCLLFY